jgi:protein-S-isoprenylcysteine O-methyltransferase Ste14
MTPYQRVFGSGPLLLLLALVLIVGAVKLQPLVNLPRLAVSLPVRLCLTAVVLASGGAVIIWCLSALSLRKRGRELVTAGPYGWVRHPLYTAVFLSSGLAGFLVTRIVLTLAAMLLMFVAGHVAVGYEESLMEQRFGQAWRDYARKTPRFFPRLSSRWSLVAGRWKEP